MTRIRLLVFAMLLCGFAAAQDKIKVACIGNSITAGSGIKDGERTYPKQLQQLLGDRYEVRNFGVSGRTMLKKGDRPYWNEKALMEAKDFAPDIVVIKLGTNDSKPQNWKYSAEFEADSKAFIEQFKALPSKPAIWVCYPIPVFKENFGIRDSIVKGEVIPMLKKAAKEEKVKKIDLYKALKGYGSHAADGVHPDETGAGQIARTVYKAIKHYKIKRPV